MMKLQAKKPIRFASISALLLVISPALGFLYGCTDLTEVPTSSIAPENFYKNEEEIIGGLAAVYAQLRSTTDDYYNVSEVSSDEYIVPTRGTDWYDNGRWLEIDRQVWGANTPSGLSDINGAWNALLPASHAQTSRLPRLIKYRSAASLWFRLSCAPPRVLLPAVAGSVRWSADRQRHGNYAAGENTRAPRCLHLSRRS
jgi:hypothetical protein